MLGSALMVLAHAGGWDELLVFAGPILVLYAALRWWDRRGDRRADIPTDPSEPSDEGARVVDDVEGAG